MTEPDVWHLQFHQPPWMRTTLAALGVLTWPIVWPLAMLARVSDAVFRTLSETLSLIPYLPGVIVRREFYRFAFESCGENLVVEFGAVFLHPNISVGRHVLIGRYNVVHRCDFGDYVLTGERCTFLHGAHYHHFERSDVPMAEQGGAIEPIRVDTDVWIGSHAVLMASVGPGAIVGAGSVVTKPVAERTIVAGNPAQRLRER